MDFRYSTSCLVTPAKLRSLATRLHPYTKYLHGVSRDDTYTSLESSLHLPFDKEILSRVHRMVRQKVTKELKTIVVVGIGGSNLGAKAVYDALGGTFGMIETHQQRPKLYWAETTDPEWIYRLSQYTCEHTSPKQFLITIISKSGGTTETIANTEYLLKRLTARFGQKVMDRIVVTSDEGSSLWLQSLKKKIAVLPIPAGVGGRFSVYSPVGLFPLIAGGINGIQFIQGARSMIEQCLGEKHISNPALISACILFEQYRQGKHIHDTFFFHPQLESLGKWYRQLLGESIGKSEHIGITPTISLGSTDLHSVGQLYLGGPRDKVTTFVRVASSRSGVSVPRTMIFPIIEGVAGKEFYEILHAIYRGVAITYHKRGVPYMETILSSMSVQSLGEWLQFKMLEIMYLGKLFHINAFDQPNVEFYKKETKRILNTY